MVWKEHKNDAFHKFSKNIHTNFGCVTEIQVENAVIFMVDALLNIIRIYKA